jgi:hypothetical protein
VHHHLRGHRMLEQLAGAAHGDAASFDMAAYALAQAATLESAAVAVQTQRVLLRAEASAPLTAAPARADLGHHHGSPDRHASTPARTASAASQPSCCISWSRSVACPRKRRSSSARRSIPCCNRPGADPSSSEFRAHQQQAPRERGLGGVLCHWNERSTQQGLGPLKSTIRTPDLSPSPAPPHLVLPR